MRDSLGQEVAEVVAAGRSYPLPGARPDGWAMSPEVCQFLGALVRRCRPRRVLEFGSGYSSVVIAAELERQGQGFVDSIDHGTRWSAAAADMARAAGAQARAAFHCFPLRLRVYGGFPCVFYRMPRAFWDGRSPYELVVIDGPHHDIGRDGALLESFPRLTVGAWIVVDDGRADHIQRTLGWWRRLLGGGLASAPLVELGNGVVVLRKVAPVPVRGPRPTAAWLGLWLRTARNVWRVHRLGLNSA